MTTRKEETTAPAMTAQLRQQLLQGIQPIRKDEHAIYRGLERHPLLSVRSPGQARFLTHSLRQFRLCAERRRLETTNPPAIKIHKTAVAGHLLIEPLATFDKEAPDQYEVKWLQGFRQAYVDLLPVLQPRNMEVPKGFVSEIPVLADELAPGQHYLILFLNDIVTREVDEEPELDESEAEEQVAASKQDDETL